jgi:endonuclease/exonuclease/phosphatase (EEP) superfamily protein YafD
VFDCSLLILYVSLLFIIFTFASLIRWNNWWIRIFDFPRLQIGVILCLLLAAGIVFFNFTEWWHYVITGLLAVSIFYQVRKIYQYTIFVRKQVLSYKGDSENNAVSLIVSNVLQTNRKASKLNGLIERLDPDLVLALETDDWWENALKKNENKYSYTLKKPQDNLYGMLLYSKLELKNAKIEHLVEPDIPSFEAMAKLKSGRWIKIYCLHPKPPFPSESNTAANRDAELLIVGKMAIREKVPVLLFGDFNDVAWSNTTRLFQKISKLLDPRIGRGFFNTFHAKYPLLRWSLDHIFHSSHFHLAEIKRLNKIGSDHFPIYIKLHCDDSALKKQKQPKADSNDKRRASEKIEEASSTE